MSQVIAWCGFLGTWLLVAGPIYQAAIDLNDEDFGHEDIEQLRAGLSRPDPVSRWWLLVPPVAYLLRVRRDREYEAALIDALGPEQVEQFLHFRETASAWMFVAVGAFLIAVTETWGLREEYGWPTWAFWALLVFMLALCVTNIAARVRRRQAIIEHAQP